jgi:hypothetical protein
VVVHNCNPSTCEAVQEDFEFEASLGIHWDPDSKNKQNKTYKKAEDPSPQWHSLVLPLYSHAFSPTLTAGATALFSISVIFPL